MPNLGLHAKAMIAALGAAASAALVALDDGVLEGSEIGTIIGALLVGGGLTWVAPFANYLKLVAATVVSLAGALVVALDDGVINHDEWYGLIAIIATAIATYSAPIAPRSVVGPQHQ